MLILRPSITQFVETKNCNYEKVKFKFPFFFVVSFLFFLNINEKYIFIIDPILNGSWKFTFVILRYRLVA